ncbi:Uncharacterised protein [Halioglobus japonicus]|nr:Uncharacterised protein [Halioglobus japonicus]
MRLVTTQRMPEVHVKIVSREYCTYIESVARQSVAVALYLESDLIVIFSFLGAHMPDTPKPDKPHIFPGQSVPGIRQRKLHALINP